MNELGLTPYEQQVLAKLAAGKLHKEIAADLSKSPAAIQSCAKSIAKKASRAGYKFARVLVRAENSGR